MKPQQRIGLRLSVLAVALALALMALAPSLAQADVFGPITLASASAIPGFGGNQQAVYAHDSAISGNGRYVVFDGSYAGRTGVWLRDLQTGAVEAVATQDPNDPSISAPDASLPSISDDGRFVSFTTTAQLDPADDTNHAPDVYVRDMDVAAGQPCEPGPGSAQPCAFTLVSAADGANAGLSYEQPVEGEKNFGSIAAGRSAISADGREVAFVTSAISNLAGAGTPALQVAVRYLDSDHTELVSVADEPASGDPLPGQPVSGLQGEVYGAVFTGAGGAAPRFTATEAYPPPFAIGASISGDGSTVAWMGVNIAKQAKLLPGETLNPNYAEPLWRRIGDGPGAPIRRITGGSDPTNPACVASGEAVLPEGQPSAADPCQGPFFGAQMGRSFGMMASGEFVDPVPQMSRDGYAVAFLADAPLVALGEGFGTNELHTDLYLANMHEGLTRAQALRPLTELASAEQGDVAEDGPIEDVAISPDGSHVAFTTKRTIFPLGSPAYVSAPAGAPGMLELFSVDLADDTLARVSDGFEGGPSEHPHSETVANEDPYTLIGDGALSPSFSDDGNTIAFSSTASNLVFGDGNTPPLRITNVDGSDAFLVSRELFDPLPTLQSISAPPIGPALKGAWRLGVTVRSRADGTVLLYASLPGAGTVTAGARSDVRVRVKRGGRVSTSVAMRSVATTKKASRAAAGALVTLTLKLAPKYRSLAGRRPGLAGAVSVTFAAAHHPTLRANVLVSFLRSAKPAKKKPKKANAKSRSQHRPSAKGAS